MSLRGFYHSAKLYLLSYKGENHQMVTYFTSKRGTPKSYSKWDIYNPISQRLFKPKSHRILL